MDEAIKCPYCNRAPHEIPEYRDAAYVNQTTAEAYVKAEEGTYDPRTKLFCCTDCYIKIGTPLNGPLREAFQYYRREVDPIV